MLKKQFITIFYAVFFFIVCSSAMSQNQPNIRHIVVFGDSLSDNGNYWNASNKALPPPPYTERASNGLVWPEYLAKFLNTTLDDNAYIGALTGGQNDSYPLALPVMAQVSNYIEKHGKLDGDNTLYILWAGANNIFQIDFVHSTFRVPFVDLLQSIALLQSHGARYFLIPGLPDFGNIALTNEVDQYKKIKPILSIFSLQYNFSIKKMVDLLNTQSPGTVIWSDIDFLFTKIQSKMPDLYGFQNTINSCYQSLPNLPRNPKGVCRAPNTYLFWDFLHTTTKGHCYVANFMHANLSEQGWTSKPPEDEFKFCFNISPDDQSSKKTKK